MINRAGALLSQFLRAESCSTGVAARLLRGGEGFAVNVERERPGDEAHRHDGRAVLLLDRAVAGFFENDTLDGDEGSGALRILAGPPIAAMEAEAAADTAGEPGENL